MRLNHTKVVIRPYSSWKAMLKEFLNKKHTGNRVVAVFLSNVRHVWTSELLSQP